MDTSGLGPGVLLCGRPKCAHVRVPVPDRASSRSEQDILGGQRQSKKMLKDFLCKMGGPERQSGLVLGAWVPVEGCIQILT